MPKSKARSAVERALFVAYLIVSELRLLSSDCLRGANTSASTAVHTLVGIDYINITSRDSLYRTFVDARATRYAQIGIDFVSHCSKFNEFKKFRYANIYKKSRLRHLSRRILVRNLDLLLLLLVDHIEAGVGYQYLGDTDTVLGLIVLEQCSHDAGQCQR